MLTSSPPQPSVPSFPCPELRQRPLRYGAVELASRYVLAPLAGYTNLAFRHSVRGVGGVGLATTDLVNARALLLRSRKTMELIQTCPEDRPLAVQIYGANPEEMCEAAQWLEAYGASVIDINMGCPVHKVTKGGGGSAMMCETTSTSTVDMVRSIVESVRIPVTVKMRLGWDEETLTAPQFARAFEEAGVAAVIIHGRTREQGFGGRVNLNGIRQVVEAVERIPVIGNGDVRSIADAVAMLATTGCAGIAIGRGALLNPWFFVQLKRWEETGDPGPGGTYLERLAFMDQHFHLLAEHRGEQSACLCFRKVASWYSRVLRPGKDIQQQLVLIDSVAHFEDLVEEIARRLQGREAASAPEVDLPIRVPTGPIEHW
jgi:tRNA-dihydrouridine synthase B